MRKHSMGLFFAIVCLLTSLLPASPWQPAAIASGTFAPSVVTVPAAVVRDALWITHAQNQLAQSDKSDVTAFILLLQHLYRQNPQMLADEAVTQIRTLQVSRTGTAGTESNRLAYTADEQLLDTFAKLSIASPSNTPTFTALVAAIQEAYTLTLGIPITTLGPAKDRIRAAPELHYGPHSVEDAEYTVLQQSLTLAQTNAQFGQAFDTLWSTALGISIDANADQLIAQSPILSEWSALRESLDASGSLQTSPEQMQTLVQHEFTQINSVTEDVLTGLQTEQALVAASNSSAPSLAAPPFTEEEIQALREKLDKAKPKVEALARFISRYDADLGYRISVVGKSAVTIAESVLQIGSGIAQLALPLPIRSALSVALAQSSKGSPGLPQSSRTRMVSLHQHPNRSFWKRFKNCRSR